ncbi:hypothetical protein [Zavarzinia compransoris]|uniref:Uncharacterized protein n=1 Tax=Zavarzinia compransoris TaxID=1264899 RepID=A0A317E8J1_9PROT|nr:hypothetical protein [Zavarzinia compransoris]PWR23031.1 hypothetical protein DKG75_00170 [Zavarzinia compransoris]TDP46424.1 hypothetical protein DES42_104513 [Zavarzinia compransoris]
MRRRLMSALMLAAAVLAAGPARAEVDVIRSADQLQRLFADRTLVGRFLSGDTFKEYYAPDGRVAYFQLQCLHSGTWWVESLAQDFGMLQAGTPIICFDYPSLNAKDDPSCFAVGGPTGRERFYPIGGDPGNTGIPGAIAEQWSQGNTEPLPLGEDGCPSV